ncbi:leucine-rich repeat domain-containing protein [Tepidibacter hydrothermalis]|uniref:Uncharacterized protein n=1 Tax=Tepidibacter hydrothermalis TaxID=3036126 RepID=A0ABY8EDQ5_9FIRM|nr:hypothetical protein [Tepidibacter hydrothermalis]WFD11078.1 hypothetical protein P4S50_03105 [Tepidibacter hydrothermalis]
MEGFKISKKELFFYTSILIIAMVVHLFYTNMAVDGEVPFIWVCIIIWVIIGELKKESRKGIFKRIFIKSVLPMIMVLNYVLFRFSMNIPNYILFFIVGCSYLIIVYNNSFDKYKIIFSVSIVSLLLIFFYTDYYIKSNNIIKDINFRNYISNQYDIKDKIESSSLNNIEELDIYGSADINSIEGIEYFSNLKELNISGAYKINDFSPLTKNKKLKDLGLWHMDLNDLKSIPEVNNIENLEIGHPEYGKIYNLEQFTNLKKLDISSVEYMENLNCIKSVENIEKLYIYYSQISTLDGIEKFENLEELYLDYIHPLDVSKVFELENLKKVSIHDCKIQKQYTFIQKLKDKGVKVEME